MNQFIATSLSTKAPVDSKTDKFLAGIEKCNHSALTFEKQLQKAFTLFCRFFGKLFKSAIILFVLGYFVPELRETIPSVYRMVDCILYCVEYLYKLFWQLIG